MSSKAAETENAVVVVLQNESTSQATIQRLIQENEKLKEHTAKLKSFIEVFCSPLTIATPLLDFFMVQLPAFHHHQFCLYQP